MPDGQPAPHAAPQFPRGASRVAYTDEEKRDMNFDIFAQPGFWHGFCSPQSDSYSILIQEYRPDHAAMQTFWANARKLWRDERVNFWPRHERDAFVLVALRFRVTKNTCSPSANTTMKNLKNEDDQPMAAHAFLLSMVFGEQAVTQTEWYTKRWVPRYSQDWKLPDAVVGIANAKECGSPSTKRWLPGGEIETGNWAPKEAKSRGSKKQETTEGSPTPSHASLEPASPAKAALPRQKSVGAADEAAQAPKQKAKPAGGKTAKNGSQQRPQAPQATNRKTGQKKNMTDQCEATQEPRFAPKPAGRPSQARAKGSSTADMAVKPVVPEKHRSERSQSLARSCGDSEHADAEFEAVISDEIADYDDEAAMQDPGTNPPSPSLALEVTMEDTGNDDNMQTVEEIEPFIMGPPPLVGSPRRHREGSVVPQMSRSSPNDSPPAQNLYELRNQADEHDFSLSSSVLPEKNLTNSNQFHAINQGRNPDLHTYSQPLGTAKTANVSNGAGIVQSADALERECTPTFEARSPNMSSSPGSDRDHMDFEDEGVSQPEMHEAPAHAGRDMDTELDDQSCDAQGDAVPEDDQVMDANDDEDMMELFGEKPAAKHTSPLVSSVPIPTGIALLSPDSRKRRHSSGSVQIQNKKRATAQPRSSEEVEDLALTKRFAEVSQAMGIMNFQLPATLARKTGRINHLEADLRQTRAERDELERQNLKLRDSEQSTEQRFQQLSAEMAAAAALQQEQQHSDEEDSAALREKCEAQAKEIERLKEELEEQRQRCEHIKNFLSGA